jgi:hypothetical protein
MFKYKIVHNLNFFNFFERSYLQIVQNFKMFIFNILKLNNFLFEHFQNQTCFKINFYESSILKKEPKSKEKQQKNDSKNCKNL